MSEYNAEVSPLLVGASTSYETPSPISLNGDSIQTRVYAKRWGVLFVFSFLSVMNNLTQYSFSPISLITQDYYNVSSLKVNLLAVVFMITGFTTRFIAMWIIDNKGLGTGIFIAAILNLIGSWVRYFPGFENYYWLFVGQSICAVAQSFIDIAGPKIAANWFPPKERTTATAFSQGPIFISLLLAYAIVPHAVKQDTVKHDLPMYLLIEAILTTASTVFIFLFFRGEPPHPPSYSAASDKLQFKEAIQILIKKKNFLIMFFVFGITLGSALAFSVLMEQVITPEGYTTTDASTLGSVWIAFAIIGGFVGGPILTLSLSTLGTVCFTLVLQFSKKNVPLLCVIIAFTGLGGAGFPAILEGTIETIYPVPEATAMGILFLGLNITGVVFVLLMEQLKDPRTGSMIKSMWGVVFLCVIGISAVFFFKSDYRRLHFENQIAQRKEEKKEKEENGVNTLTPYASFHA